MAELEGSTRPAGGRIVCALVPLFSLAARLRAEPELRDEAVAVLAGRGDKARVVAATRRARKAGVRPGFTLSQARARLPRLVARPRDAECERAAQEALLDVAESFSPRIEDAGDGVIYLDAEGLERLFAGSGQDEGGDPDLALGRALAHEAERRAGVPVWVGVAASKLAARVAAEGGGVEVVPSGQEAEYLANLPLDRLSPEAGTLTTLERWGVHLLGDFARLPAAEVVSRLGPAGEQLHAIARGEDPTPLVPRTPPPTFREGMEIDWPLVSLEPFLFVARAALDRLVQRMECCGLGCRRLELSMELEPDGHHERSITLPAPTRDVKTLLKLVHLDLEAHPPGAPVVSFALTAHPDRPRGAQLSLFGPEALSPDKLATTLARLFSLLGEDRVGSPRTEDSHLPESVRLVPFQPPPPPKTRCEAPKGKGLLGLRVLRPALPVEVMTDSLAPAPADANPSSSDVGHRVAYEGARRPCEERPVSVTTQVTGKSSKKPRIHGVVQVASGPWVLEESWWDGDAVERDYWDLELSGGGLYRAYRERHSGDWYVDGIYD
ncbi:MAG: DNA polymerase Y family protein [Thermoanaerobaculia bacterium]|nr:DNA polymerase Y family protein [Thermoanaerobaculia bacterium]